MNHIRISFPRSDFSSAVSNKLTRLDDRLALRIHPQAIRLKPGPEDGYALLVTDGKAHMMTTSLGSGSVGLYDAICREIGRSIEAVRPAAAADMATGSEVGHLQRISAWSLIRFSFLFSVRQFLL